MKTFIFSIGIVLMPVVVEGGTVISGDTISEVTNSDANPILGGGYNNITNSFKSKCITFNPRFTTLDKSYEYIFADLNTQDATQAEYLSTRIFSYDQAQREAESRLLSKVRIPTFTYLSSMRIDRDHAIGDQTVRLSPDATTLLQSKDFAGFFKGFGPNYISRIKSAQEITSVFKFNSYSSHLATEFASELEGYIHRVGVVETTEKTLSTNYTNRIFQNLTLVDEEIAFGADFTADAKFNVITESLKILIYGYGMKLDPSKPEMLVATSVKEYNEVLYKILENSQNERLDTPEIGAVYEVEVENFVDNQAFQAATNLDGDTIDLPVPESSVDRAYRTGDPNDINFDPNNRDSFTCNDGKVIDMHGYCCDASYLYDRNLGQYDQNNEAERVCRQLEAFQTSIVKENLMVNGEFVDRLDAAFQDRLNQLSMLEYGISAISSLSAKEFYTLRAQNGADDTVDFTVGQLKRALDPNGDYGLVKHMADELDEYMSMFQEPCHGALYGTNLNIGSHPDNDFFMTHTWESHDECSYTSCLSQDMRWNREAAGGCVPSLITGSDASRYMPNANYDDSNCMKEIRGNNEVCKFSTESLDAFQVSATNCWINAVPSASISHVLNAYGAVEVTNKRIGSAEEAALQQIFNIACPGSNFLLRRRRRLLSTELSEKWSGL